MSNRIEIESKFFCDNEEEIIKLIKQENMVIQDETHEIDEYFTDLNSEYIKNRTCLRIRKINDKNMELTFKGKSKVMDNMYAKKESNIEIGISE